MTDSYLLLAYLLFLAAIATTEMVLAGDIRKSCKRLVANYGLGVLTLLVAMSLPVQLVSVAVIAEHWRFGLLYTVPLHALVASLFSFLVLDAVNYLTHRLLHTPLLWPFHAVHHSDLRLDHSSGLRFHPIEFLVHITTASAAILVLGATPAGVAAYTLAAAIWNLALHTSLRAPRTLDAMNGTFLLMPAHHRVHHSQRAEDVDRNYGTVFSFWDRMFGTYRHIGRYPRGTAPPGISSVTECDAEDFHTLLTKPFHVRKQKDGE